MCGVKKKSATSKYLFGKWILSNQKKKKKTKKKKKKEKKQGPEHSERNFDLPPICLKNVYRRPLPGRELSPEVPIV